MSTKQMSNQFDFDGAYGAWKDGQALNEAKKDASKGLYIAVDFDGTCVFEEWPEVGEDNPYAVEVLKECVKNGHKIILLTIREHETKGIEGRDLLKEAEDWFKKNEIPLYAVNENPEWEEKVGKSRKVYADVIIDDKCCNMHTIEDENSKGELCEYCSWRYIDKWMVKRGVYKSRVTEDTDDCLAEDKEVRYEDL